MQRFIARQPIFNRKNQLFGYELLFRSSLENYFDGTDLDKASSNVIANSFLLFSIEEMTDSTSAFLKATHKILKSGYVSALPKQSVVVEIQQPLTPDAVLVEACRRLKRAGYTLALDDFDYDPAFAPLLDTIDIVKIDLLNTSVDDCREFADLLLPLGKKLHAVKVENHGLLDQGKAMGFELFQGYYFSKPAVLSRKDIPANKLKFIQILKEVNAPEIDFQKLATMIQEEMSVS